MKRAQHKSQSATSRRLDAGLLLLRLGLGLAMIILHGVPHLQLLADKVPSFLPLFGIGGRATLVLAVVVEIGGAGLLIFGWFTRAAAIALATLMAVAFVVVHGASFEGEQSGELAFLYLICASVLTLTGPGRYGCDSK
jgi:putative oxidoreductase